MHLEFQPADAPDPADPDAQFGVAPEQITTELLELCEQFFRQASTIVHTELGQFLNEHGHPGGRGLVPRRPGLHHPQPRRPGQ
jgi:hypothetical protein